MPPALVQQGRYCGGKYGACSVTAHTHDSEMARDFLINLGTEALDLSVQGHPKKVRLLRLRTPIKLQGHLKEPKIGLDAGKTVAQTGIAAALGALVTPLAAIVAFVPRQLTPEPDR